MRVPTALTGPIGAALAAAFSRLAARRGGEAVHTHGVELAGTVVLEPRSPAGAVLLDRPGTYEVRARLSWGLGLWQPLPDVPGLGLRVLDADGRGGIQDLILDGCRPVPHDRVPVLRRELAGWYGTLLRLRRGAPDGPKVQVAVRLDGAGRDLADAAAGLAGRLVAHDRGRLLAVGTLRLHPAGPHDGLGDSGRIRFDLVAGGRPVGAVQAENWRAWDFAISDASGSEVARITKTWEGLARTLFTTADNYVVRVHQRLEDPLASLVLASALTVDTALKQDDRGFN